MPSEIRVDKVSSTTSPYDAVFSTTGGALSHRNMVINGGMTVAQRGTSFTSIHGDQYAVDRFKFDCGAEDQLRVTITRENSGPTGFSHSVKVDVTTAESAIDSDEYARISTIIESQDLQHLDYGASGAKTTTISFYVKSSLTGTYAMQLYQFDGAQIIGTTYTINTANTWEKKTITFVGNTSQAIANDNTSGIRLNFILMAGNDYTGTANSSWGAYSAAKFANGHTAAWGTNASHDFWISGVQWEVGTVATPFEHRSHADELRRCMRYYYQNQSEWFVDTVGSSYNTMSTIMYAHHIRLHVPVSMRADPSVGIVSVFAGGNSSSGTNVTNKYGVAGAKKEFVNIRNSSGAYSTAGDVYVKYTLEAELVT